MLLPATADGEVAHTVIGPVPICAAGRGSGTVLWRPESLSVRRVGSGGHGVCTGVEFVGASTLARVWFDTTDRSFAIPVPQGRVVEVGDRVEVTPLRAAVFHEGAAPPG